MTPLPVGSQERSLVAPFLGGDLPYLSHESSGDIIPFMRGNHSHSSLLGNAPRGDVRNRFRSAQNAEAEYIKPIVVDGHHRFGHQALPMPGQPQPISAVV